MKKDAQDYKDSKGAGFSSLSIEEKLLSIKLSVYLVAMI